MATTFAWVQDEAASIAAIARKISLLSADIDSLLAHNSAQALDWGAAQTPTAIEESVDGNISGAAYTRQQISNAIGSLAAIQTLLAAGHLGNLDLVRSP